MRKPEFELGSSRRSIAAAAQVSAIISGVGSSPPFQTSQQEMARFLRAS